MQRSRWNKIPLFVFVLLTTVFVVCLASCGPSMKTYRVYAGPELPGSETAQLLCEGEKIQLNSVKGQKSFTRKDISGKVTLEILPGDYDLTVSFSGRSMTTVFGDWYSYNIFYRHNSTDNVNISMKAEAGHTYLVTSDHNYEKDQWYAVIRDETAGKRILKEGPYPLDKIRTGDNQATRQKYRQ